MLVCKRNAVDINRSDLITHGLNLCFIYDVVDIRDTDIGLRSAPYLMQFKGESRIAKAPAHEGNIREQRFRKTVPRPPYYTLERGLLRIPHGISPGIHH
ncbi:hypothetical protein D3C77_659510 [compost metagenome]